MHELPFNNMFATDDVFEILDKNYEFKDFIGRCISHFLNIALPDSIPGRYFERMYDVPMDIPDVYSSVIYFIKPSYEEKIYITFTGMI